MTTETQSTITWLIAIILTITTILYYWRYSSKIKADNLQIQWQRIDKLEEKNEKLEEKNNKLEAKLDDEIKSRQGLNETILYLKRRVSLLEGIMRKRHIPIPPDDETLPLETEPLQGPPRPGLGMKQ